MNHAFVSWACRVPPAFHGPRAPTCPEIRWANGPIRSSKIIWTSSFKALRTPMSPAVEEAFRAFLRCGRPEFGFILLRCKSCHYEHPLAFSCKRRSLCPSCCTRRMEDTAAPPPSPTDLMLITRRVFSRMEKHLKRNGYLDADDPDKLTALDRWYLRASTSHRCWRLPDFSAPASRPQSMEASACMPTLRLEPGIRKAGSNCCVM